MEDFISWLTSFGDILETGMPKIGEDGEVGDEYDGERQPREAH